MAKVLEFGEEGEVPQPVQTIEAIDMMFDAPTELSTDLIQKAHEVVLPRVADLCRPIDPATEQSLLAAGITDISEPKSYKTLQGTDLEIFLCMRPLVVDETESYPRMGLLVSSQPGVIRPTPVLELSGWSMMGESVTTQNRGLRQNQATDLASFLKAVELFDGQPFFS